MCYVQDRMVMSFFETVLQHRTTLLSSRRKTRWRISVVEHKLILTLAYFVVFGTMSLVLLAVTLADQDRTQEIIHNYFLCEAPGLNINPNCNSNLTELTEYSNLATATYSLLGLFPLVILAFTINWKLVGKKTKAFLTKHGCMHPKHDHGVVVFSSYSPLPSATANN